jgi:hypothetical protein
MIALSLLRHYVHDYDEDLAASRAARQDLSHLITVIRIRCELERFLLPEKHKGMVVTSDDLTRVKPIRTTTSVSGLKHSREPILAAGKVRFVGEIVAACVGRSPMRPPLPIRGRRSATHRLFRFPPTLMAWPYRTVKPLAQFEPKWLE